MKSNILDLGDRINETVIDFNKQQILLNSIQSIPKNTENALLVSLLKEFKKAKKSSSKELKALLCLYVAIIQHERLYFAITRRSFKELVKTNPMLKGVTFSDRNWSKLLKFFYSSGIIENVHPGTRVTAQGFKVVDKVLVEYLQDKVDAEKQKEELLNFCTPKKRKTKA